MTRKTHSRLAREGKPGNRAVVEKSVNVEEIQKKQQAILSRIGSLYINRDNLQNQIDQINAQINHDMNLLNGLADLTGQAPPPVPTPASK